MAEKVYYFGHLLRESQGAPPSFEVILVEADLPDNSVTNATLLWHSHVNPTNKIVVDRQRSETPILIFNEVLNDKITVDRNSTGGNENGNIDLSANARIGNFEYQFDLFANRKVLRGSGRQRSPGKESVSSYKFVAESVSSLSFLKYKIRYKYNMHTKFLALDKKKNLQETTKVSSSIRIFQQLTVPYFSFHLGRLRIGVPVSKKKVTEVKQTSIDSTEGYMNSNGKVVGRIDFAHRNPFLVTIDDLINFSFTKTIKDDNDYYSIVSKADVNGITISQEDKSVLTFSLKSQAEVLLYERISSMLMKPIKSANFSTSLFSGLIISSYFLPTESSKTHRGFVAWMKSADDKTINIILSYGVQFIGLSFKKIAGSNDYILTSPGQYQGKLIDNGKEFKLVAISLSRNKALKGSFKFEEDSLSSSFSVLNGDKKVEVTHSMGLLKSPLSSAVADLFALEKARKREPQKYKGKYKAKVDGRALSSDLEMTLRSRGIGQFELNFNKSAVMAMRVAYVRETESYQIYFFNEEEEIVDCEADFSFNNELGTFDPISPNMEIKGKCVYPKYPMMKKKLLSLSINEKEFVFKQISSETNNEMDDYESKPDESWAKLGTILMKLSK